MTKLFYNVLSDSDLNKDIISKELFTNEFTISKVLNSLENFVPWANRDDLGTVEERQFALYFKCRPVDRTRKLNQSREYKILSEIPKGTTDLTFDEIVYKAVDKVIEESKGRDIHLLWSGGIDSTSVLYALLERDVDLTVIMDNNSKNEYPDLFNFINNGYVPIIGKSQPIRVKSLFDSAFLSKVNVPELAKNPRNYFVTGEIGDQIFGSHITFSYKPEYRHDLSCRHIPINIYEFMEETISQVIPDYYNSTLAQWLWAANFTCKYQHVLTRMTKGFYIANFEPFLNCTHFFDTENFQRWAIQNYKKNCGWTKDSNYKERLKRYILKCNGDKDYYEKKRKVGSLIQSNYNRIDAERYLNYPIDNGSN